MWAVEGALKGFKREGFGLRCAMNVLGFRDLWFWVV